MGKTKKSAIPPSPVQPEIYYSLHTLLETIRVIKIYEDPLCTLLHDIRTTGGASSEVERELQSLLDEMPSAAYTLELDDLRGKLAQAPTAAPPAADGRRKTASAKRPVTPRTAGKG